MTYKLQFKKGAKKEWDKLGPTIRDQFKKKLIERIENPRVEASRLRNLQDCYKIKLRRAGYRLVYEVRDRELIISIIAVGSRERSRIYDIAARRI